MLRSWLRSRFQTARRARVPARHAARLEVTHLESRDVPSTVYSIQWLGTVNAADNYSIARAINDNGQVVGASGVMNPGVINGSANVVGPYQAYSWTAAGGMVGLGPLTGQESQAFGLNNTGTIVGNWHYYMIPYTPNGGGYYEWAFVYQNGPMGTIPGHAQIGAHSSAQAVNDSGVITGSTDVSTVAPAGSHQAFVYDGTSFTLLGTLGGQWSYGMDINNNGMVVGMADTGLGVPPPGALAVSLYHAFEWTAAGGMKDLGTLGGQSYASSVNDAGMVAGYSEVLNSSGQVTAYHPFLYDGTKMIDIIGNLGPNAMADAINNAGQVVGGASGSAWLYQNGTTTDLNTLIPAGAGTLVEAYDINNKGQIVGLGMHNGHYDSFLLTPTTAMPPTITLTGGTFAYDATPHAASAAAIGVGNAAVAGSFTFTYNGSSTVPTAAGTYAVVATFTSGDPAYSSATGTATVTITPATPSFSRLSVPAIAQGTPTTSVSGHLAAGTVIPVGDNVSITLNGVTQTAAVDATGAFTSSFATSSLPAGSYSVTVAFAGDGANFAATTNGNATLTVTTSAGAPVVTTDPTSVTVVSGKHAAFHAAATGSLWLSIQWQVSTDGGNTFGNINGATHRTLSFYTDPSQDGYEYRAIFTNRKGIAVTTAATLTVTVLPKLTLQPQDVDVVAGAQATLTAGAKYATSVQWQVSIDGGKTFTNVLGANATTLTFTTSAGQNGYRYRAVFSNAAGSTATEVAILTVESNA